MIKFTKIVSAFALGIALLFTGCSNLVEENMEQSSEYGTLIYGEDIRAINVDSVKTAKVFVTGNGITSPLTSEATKVEKGRGSVTIEKIPVGKNRIVTVQGYSDSNATAEVVDAVLRAVIDINPGVNTLPLIDWDVSRKGYVYNALFESGVNISSLSSAEMAAVDAATPSCDATNINLSLFVEDFKKGYDKLQASSAYIISVEKTLKRLTVEKAASSTESAPAFTATAYYSDGTNEDVTSSATWNSTESAVATVSGGNVTLVAAGKTVISASHTFGGVTKTGAKQTVTVTSQGAGVVVYILSTYDEAAGGANIYGWKNSDKPYGVWPGTKMSKTDDGNAYYFIVNDTSKVAGFNINSVSDNNKKTPDLTMPETDGHWLYYYDASSSKWTKKEYEGTRVSLPGGSLSAAINSEAVTDPVPPTVTITPAGGNISLSGSIKVTFTDGNDTISFASVEINGTSYDMGTKAGTFSKSLKDLGITTDSVPINVSASVTNGQGTTTVSAAYTSRYVDPSKVDVFTWDNVNAYFVLTDRFYNGDTTNDHSYYRKNDLSGDENVATFHGGDIAGLTQKLDYFDKLGVNAIWITAPYEQAHGWVGGKNGAFPHYAFHGYYTLDWTSMDQNMGTVEELRTFVNACHSKGIRVIMDVVMNHVGYNNTQDMVTFNHGYTEHTENGWLEKTTNPKSGQVEWYANDTVKWENSYWDSTWFGPWIRSFGYASGSEYGGSCGGLPDVKTELTSSVGMAPVLVKKWKDVDSDDYKAKYYNPSVANADWNGYSGDYRTDKNIAPADYQVVWLSAWVRELGIDGFRCDTAKHVEPFRWGQLKVACEAALEAWRNDSSKVKTYNGADTGAEDWDESFWMTGECFGWTSTAGQGDYYTTGKFDSMINFSFNGAAGSGTSSSYPNSNTWESYLNINKNSDSDENGNRNNVLTYVSSHDTRLCRASNQSEVGTMLTLLPGGVQIYYGDETSRSLAYTGCGDTDMMTRGDFNWADATGETAKHWGKVGTFRKFNPAVGAGTGSATKRTYSGPAGESKVAIGISGSSVDVKDLFADGTTVYNWYDGASATVSGGKVDFTGGTTSQPILVSDKNPADYGVEF